MGYSSSLKPELRSYISKKRRGADKSIPWGVDFLDRLELYATSGKLLRGSVLCFAYEAFSGKAPDKAAVRAAMALELTHSALLIHDDIMDDDDKRRGRPSMHSQYREVAEREKLAEPARFGVNMALSGADAALFIAVELLGSSQVESGAGVKHYSLFADQLLKTCSGQMQDVYFDARPATPSKKAIYDLMKTKTASYTLALPLAMGASLADASEPVLRRLQAIGVAGGTIFQIRDDELGVLGDTKKTGKPVGSDIKEGKKTLLYYYLAKGCAPDERAKLKSIFGNLSATPQDISYVQTLVKRRGIPKLLGGEVAALREKAFVDIDKLPLARSSKKELESLISFCARRQL